MNTTEAKLILDKVVGQVFGYQNPLTLEQAMQKFAFDIRVPQQVYSTSGSVTWAQSVNPTKFVSMGEARTIESGIRPARPLNSIQDILTAWNEINYTTTERYSDSINVSESDNIMNSENIYRSQDIRHSKNIIFSDNMTSCEYMVACQGVSNCAFGIRVVDSGEVANSFEISWCGKVTNSMFLHDCGDMQDSMFCTNMKGGRFCVANMQFDEAEYYRLREMVVYWVLTS